MSIVMKQGNESERENEHQAADMVQEAEVNRPISRFGIKFCHQRMSRVANILLTSLGTAETQCCRYTRRVTQIQIMSRQPNASCCDIMGLPSRRMAPSPLLSLRQ
jgi:hypothetical protein